MGRLFLRCIPYNNNFITTENECTIYLEICGCMMLLYKGGILNTW